MSRKKYVKRLKGMSASERQRYAHFANTWGNFDDYKHPQDILFRGYDAVCDAINARWPDKRQASKWLHYADLIFQGFDGRHNRIYSSAPVPFEFALEARFQERHRGWGVGPTQQSIKAANEKWRKHYVNRVVDDVLHALGLKDSHIRIIEYVLVRKNNKKSLGRILLDVAFHPLYDKGELKAAAATRPSA